MDYEYTPVRGYCQNCGHKMIGYRSRDGTVRMRCGRCGTVAVSKRKNAHITDTRLYAPARGQFNHKT